MDFKQYVIHIISDNYNFGCGVLVGNSFITAGHVIEESVNPRIKLSDDTIFLTNPIVFHNDNYAEGYDIAVYNISEANSPLQLASSLPLSGDNLKSCSWRVIPEGNEYLECNAVVKELQEGNYFYCDTDVQLKPGSSGSPVFKEGKVIGILAKGQEGTSLCAFLSAKAILKILRTRYNL